MNDGYYTVDEFCEDVDYVVDSARAAGFGRWAPNKGLVGSSIYDGMNFMGAHAPMVRDLMVHTNKIVVPNTMFFRSTQIGTEQAYIHSDREMGNYTCVAYLSEHEEPFGTAFFRHIPTGLTRMPSFAEMMEQGIFEQLRDDMVSRDPAVWEQIDYIEGKYNRALIFEAPLFHSRYPLEGIGSNDDSGRLVWVSHFYVLGNGGLT